MEKVKVGIIGCGAISDVYMTNITRHCGNLELAAVANRSADKAKAAAEKFHIPVACSTEELLGMEEIRIVLDLTVPAAHYGVNRQILEAGKNLYSEKPFAIRTEEANELIGLAAAKGLMAAGAPDTFLGAGAQTARALLDAGRIGKPFGFTANMTCPGHELWHPNPGFYYQKGGGPMFDMGPYYMTTLVCLLGPVKRISAFLTSGWPVRNILGKMTETEVPTHYTGTMEFANGAVGTVTMSFDTWYSSLPRLEIYGTEGTLVLPDPNCFGGQVRLFDGKQNRMQEVAPLFPQAPDPSCNMRGLGVSDMACALTDGRGSRLRSDVLLHVVEILNAFEISARENRPCELQTTCDRPEPMDSDWALWEVM
ncbi:MAG: Gfo/Idh/MocA family oxidoreductase [Lachnospiraceae bacterium]|jgi:predicted dehydrogenase|nr:Gfo/Idh/MocA family oxidoreductase [Lachnospiraceae bacterium]